MKLYMSRNSPFSRKVFLWSHLLGCSEKIEFIDLSKSGVFILPPNYELINPLRKIPALVTEDQQTFIDSPLICDYLSRRLEQLREPHLRSNAADQHQTLKMMSGLSFFESRSSQLKNPYDRGEIATPVLLWKSKIKITQSAH